MLTHFLRAASTNTNQPSVPEYIASATATALSADPSITCNVPSGSQAGDLLVAFGIHSNSDDWTTVPSGWVFRMQEQGRVVATLEGYNGTTASYSFQKSQGPTAALTILTFRNAYWDTRGLLTTTAIINPTAPSIQLLNNKSLQLVLCSTPTANVGMSTPSDFTTMSFNASTGSPTYRSYVNNLFQNFGNTASVITSANQASRAFQMGIGRVLENPISFIAVSVNANATNPTVAVPSGVSSGDLLIMIGTTTGTITTPSGWTQLVNNSNTVRTWCAYKFAGASETSVTVTTSASTNISMFAYRGSSVAPVASTVTTSSSAQSITTSTISSNPPNSRILSVFSMNATTGFMIPYSATVRRIATATGTLRYVVVDETLTNGAFSIQRTCQKSFGSVAMTGFQISIRP